MSLKKFSTRRLTTLAIGAGMAVSGITGLSPSPASAQQATPPIELAPGAPDKHIVVKGDTLWDISSTFLKSPWRWPEVWQLNKEQIADPHWIYPGDIVYLDTSGTTPRLRLGKSLSGSMAAGGRAGDGVQRLEPVVRAEQLDKDAISTVSMAAIEAFIGRPPPRAPGS